MREKEREKKKAEGGKKGQLPGDGGRRREGREKVKKGEKRGGGGGEVWSCFQVQRVTGHDATSAAAIPPTALSLAPSEDGEEVVSLSLYKLCLFERFNCYNGGVFSN